MNRNTKQNQAIRRAVGEEGRPLSPAEVLAIAELHIPGLGMATVYRAQKCLVEERSVVAVQLRRRAAPLRGSTGGGAPPSPLPMHGLRQGLRRFRLPEGLAELTPPGFRLSGHERVLYGQCGSCMRSGREGG